MDNLSTSRLIRMSDSLIKNLETEIKRLTTNSENTELLIQKLKDINEALFQKELKTNK